MDVCVGLSLKVGGGKRAGGRAIRSSLCRWGGKKEGRRLEMAVRKVDICSPAEKVIYWVL